MASTNKFRIVFYWIATIVSTVAFIIPGIGNLMHLPHFATDMAHLGYPAYFLTIFGIWKILGAMVIIIPGFKRLKEWAYAGMFFDLIGAAWSRLCVHDEVIMALIPLLISGVVIMSWLLRPESRRF